jgi:hypothetical protein
MDRCGELAKNYNSNIHLYIPLLKIHMAVIFFKIFGIKDFAKSVKNEFFSPAIIPCPCRAAWL